MQTRSQQQHSTSSINQTNGFNMAPPAPKSVTLPHFQSKDVEFWFIQVEAIFRTGGVVEDQTMFDYVTAALDLTAASNVRDVLKEPPEADKYAALKKALIDRLAVSEAARIQQVLSQELMGDRTPSQHLRHLQAVGGSTFSEQVLKSIWMESLPLYIRPMVAANSSLALDSLAPVADTILTASGSRQVAAVDPPAAATAAPATSSVEAQIAALTAQISELTRTVKRSRQAERADGTTPAKRARSPAADDSLPTGVCWYHSLRGTMCMDWTRRQAGKRIEPVGGPAPSTADSSRRIFITDIKKGTRFLVDTGAEVSVLPVQPEDRKNECL